MRLLVRPSTCSDPTQSTKVLEFGVQTVMTSSSNWGREIPSGMFATAQKTSRLHLKIKCDLIVLDVSPTVDAAALFTTDGIC